MHGRRTGGHIGDAFLGWLADHISATGLTNYKRTIAGISERECGQLRDGLAARLVRMGLYRSAAARTDLHPSIDVDRRRERVLDEAQRAVLDSVSWFPGLKMAMGRIALSRREFVRVAQEYNNAGERWGRACRQLPGDHGPATE